MKTIRWIAGLGFMAAIALIAGAVFRPSPTGRAEPQECLATPGTGTPHPGMVWVPAGSFTFGDTVYPEEQPVRPVSVQGFWMDRTEVTNAQFAAFVAATGYVTTAERAVDTRLHPGLPLDMQQPGAVVFVSPADLRGGGDVRQWWKYIPGAQWRHPGGPSTTLQGLDALPVVAVTAEDGQAYARWKGHQLPTEQEWEWAALGSQLRSTGDTMQPEAANTWQGFFPLSNQAKDGFERAAPVGCFQANGYGLFDMIGNVWELTADRYTESHSPQNNVPPDQPPAAQRPGAPSGRHVIKGGSFLCAPNYCMRYRAAARQPQEDDLASSHVGFRTVLHAPGP
jgi:formylglycine-generating enzyme required for sulfatase activity